MKEVAQVEPVELPDQLTDQVAEAARSDYHLLFPEAELLEATVVALLAMRNAR